MDGLISPQREIATFVCNSAAGGQFLVSYDAPKIRTPLASSSSKINLKRNHEQLRCRISFENKTETLRGQPRLNPTISTINVEDVSMEKTELIPKSERCNRNEIANKSLANIKTPIRTVTTPARKTQSVIRQNASSKGLLNGPLNKPEKPTRNSDPRCRLHLTACKPPIKSLPRVIKTGTTQKIATNSKGVTPDIEVRSIAKKVITKKEIHVSTVSTIRSSDNKSDKKICGTTKTFQRTGSALSDAKKPGVINKTTKVTRIAFLEDITKNIPNIQANKVCEISPPPATSPMSPDSLIANKTTASCRRKKWKTVIDLNTLPTSSMCQLSSNVRNKSVDLLKLMGIELQEDNKEDSPPNVPNFKSSDPYTATTIRRLRETEQNLRILEIFLKEKNIQVENRNGLNGFMLNLIKPC